MGNQDKVRWSWWMSDKVLDMWKREDEPTILGNFPVAGAGSHNQSSQLPKHAKVHYNFEGLGEQTDNTFITEENHPVNAQSNYTEELGEQFAQPDLLPEHTFVQMMADEMSQFPNPFDEMEGIYKHNIEANTLSRDLSRGFTGLGGPSKTVEQMTTSAKLQEGVVQGGTSKMSRSTTDTVNPLITPPESNKNGDRAGPVELPLLHRCNGSRVYDEATNPEVLKAQRHEVNTKRAESHLENEAAEPHIPQGQLQQHNNNNAMPARSLILDKTEWSNLQKWNESNAVPATGHVRKQTAETNLQHLQPHNGRDPRTEKNIALDVRKDGWGGLTSRPDNPSPTNSNRQLTATDRKRKASDMSSKCHQPTPHRPYRPINLRGGVNSQQHSGAGSLSMVSQPIPHTVDKRGLGVIRPDPESNPNQVQPPPTVTQQSLHRFQIGMPVPPHPRTGIRGGTPPELSHNILQIGPQTIQQTLVSQHGSSLSPYQQAGWLGGAPQEFANNYHQPESQRAQSASWSVMPYAAHQPQDGIYYQSSSLPHSPQMVTTGGMSQGLANHQNHPSRQRAQTVHNPSMPQSPGMPIPVGMRQGFVSRASSQPIGTGSNLSSGSSFFPPLASYSRTSNVTFDGSQPPDQEMAPDNYLTSQSATPNYLAAQQPQITYTPTTPNTPYQYQHSLNHNIQNQGNSYMTFLTSGPGFPNNLPIQHYPHSQTLHQATMPHGQQVAYLSPRVPSHLGGRPL